MKSLLIPIVLMAAFIALVMAITPHPQAESAPLITEVVQAEATGPGFFPVKDSSECKCANCNCAELEKRVAALEAKIASYGAARPVVSNGSAGASGGVAVSRPVTTSGLPYGAVVVSERVVSSQPIYQSSPPVTTTTRTGLFGRRITRSVQAPQACRIVNGVRVCN